LVTSDENNSFPEFEDLSFTQSEGTNTYTTEHHGGRITMRRTDEYSDGQPIRWALEQAGTWKYRAKNDYDTTCPSTHINNETTQIFIRLQDSAEVVFEISDELCPDTPTIPPTTAPPTTITPPTTALPTSPPETTEPPLTTPAPTTFPPATTTLMPTTPAPPTTTVVPTEPPPSAQSVNLSFGSSSWFLSTVAGGCSASLDCNSFKPFVNDDISGGIHNPGNSESDLFEFDRIADDNFNFSSIAQGEQRLIYSSGLNDNASQFEYYQINVSGDGVQWNGRTWYTVYGSAAEGGIGPAPQGEGFKRCTEINDDPCSDAR